MILLLIFTFYYKYQKYKKIYIFNFEIKTVLYLKYINGLVGMEKRNSQLEHGQPIEQTRGLFCACSGVARCQSKHSITSGEWVRCSKLIARASELGSCQTLLCYS